MSQISKNLINFFKGYITQTFNLFKSSPAKFLIILPIVTTLYYGITMPAHVDECMSYLYFSKSGFGNIISNYTMPNNHILHTILVSLFIKIPYVDLNILIRIPAILATVLSIILTYRFIYKFYGEPIALCVTAISPLLLSSLEYCFLSRGYSMLTLFTIICLYAAFNIVRNFDTQKNWCIFTVSAILGAYTIPTFLYPFLTISVYIVILNPKGFKKQVIFSCLVGIGVLILYTPVLIVSGIEQLTNNRYVAPINRLQVIRGVPGYFMGVYIYIMGLNKVITLLILAIPLVYSIFKHDKTTIILWLIFILIPSVILVIHSVLPFFRVFFYNAIIVSMLFFISFRHMINKLSIIRLTGILLFIQVALVANFANKVTYLFQGTIVAKEKADELLEDNTSYYYSDYVIVNLFFDHMKYESDRAKLNNTFMQGADHNADNINDFDKVVISSHKDKTQFKKTSKQLEIMFYETMNIYSK